MLTNNFAGGDTSKILATIHAPQSVCYDGQSPCFPDNVDLPAHSALRCDRRPDSNETEGSEQTGSMPLSVCREWFTETALEMSNIGLHDNDFSQSNSHTASTCIRDNCGPTSSVDRVFNLSSAPEEGLDDAYGTIICPSCFAWFVRVGNFKLMCAMLRHLYGCNVYYGGEERPLSIPPGFLLVEQGPGLHSLASNIKAQYSEII